MENGLNVWAILTAAAGNFVIGGIWYSPAMFHRGWMRANGFTEAQLEKGNPALIFGGAFVCSLFMAANLAAFLAGPETDLAWGATAGLLAGLGWAALGLVVIALFERRPWSYMLINGGYLTLSFTVMGAIIGAWR